MVPFLFGPCHCHKYKGTYLFSTHGSNTKDDSNQPPETTAGPTCIATSTNCGQFSKRSHLNKTSVNFHHAPWAPNMYVSHISQGSKAVLGTMCLNSTKEDTQTCLVNCLQTLYFMSLPRTGTHSGHKILQSHFTITPIVTAFIMTLYPRSWRSTELMEWMVYYLILTPQW